MPLRLGEVLMGVATGVVATLLYVMRREAGAPWASSPLGLALGGIGLGLMLWAGFGYSARKRQRAGAPASMTMSYAMLLHMVAGLLGPYLVLLHSGMQFRGIAGVLTLTMVLVVASGVVGRALLTALPRGVMLADPVGAALLDAERARLEIALADLDRASRAEPTNGPRDATRRASLKRELAAARHAQELALQQFSQPAVASLWRSALAGWWWLHVPMSAALWVLAGTHVAGALFYAVRNR